MEDGMTINPLPLAPEDGLKIRTLQLEVARAQLTQAQAQRALEIAAKTIEDKDREMRVLLDEVRGKCKADGHTLTECLKWVKESQPPQE